MSQQHTPSHRRSHRHIQMILLIYRFTHSTNSIIIARRHRQSRLVRRLIIPTRHPIRLIRIIIIRQAPSHLPRLMLNRKIRLPLHSMHTMITISRLTSSMHIQGAFTSPKRSLHPRLNQGHVNHIRTPAINPPLRPITRRLNRRIRRLQATIIRNRRVTVPLRILVLQFPILTLPRRIRPFNDQ